MTLRRRLGAALQAVLAQPAHDVLHVHDGVVDDGAERDDEPGQHHRVDRGPARVQHEPGGHEGERHRDDADERAAPVVQEQTEDEDHEEGPEQYRGRQVVDGLLHEGGGPEDGRVDLEVRKARAHLVDGLLDVARHVERVAPRQLLDHEHEARAIVDDGVAGEERRLLDHLGDVADPQRLAIPLGQCDLGEVLRRHDGELVADAEALVRRVDEAAGADEATLRELQDAGVQGGGGDLHDVIERHLRRGELVRLDFHLVRLDPLAPDGHVGHAAHS